MYFPKSQIKTNLYTNGGDFTTRNSTTPYKGYYYETANKKYFSGKTPNESPSFELIRIKPNSSLSNLPEDLQLENIPIDNYYIIENGYLSSTNLSFNLNSPLPTKQTFPILTDNDYKLGEFQRYFLKKANEPQFLEISKEDYQKHIIKDNSVLHQLYIPFTINWVLTGNKEQVYKVNQSIVARAEREQNLLGFTQYFKDRFTQFYQASSIQTNLSTDGTEFINRRTRLPYKGLYHIHPENGPMVGGVHISTFHDFLDPIGGMSIQQTGSISVPIQYNTGNNGGTSSGGGY